MPAEANKYLNTQDITDLLYRHYFFLMKEFYEMQTGFIATRYKLLKSIETSNIVICFIRNTHLSILRQREKNLDYNISLDQFVKNLKDIEIPKQKIVSVVQQTGIPKETVRRKIQMLIKKGYILSNKNKEYYWDLSPKSYDHFQNIMQNDIKVISKFISNIAKCLNLNLSQKNIEDEINSQFSFYLYHFLTCQLTWMKMWQTKIKDIDLIFIAMQALIPTLNYTEKNLNIKNLGLENLNTIIGKANKKYFVSESSISATSISEVSGIPRPTCIRKLEKLVKLGLLVREVKTKRYYVNQHTNDRTKHITQKENVHFTIKCFSNFLSIALSAALRSKK